MSNTVLFCSIVKNKTQRYTTLIFVPNQIIILPMSTYDVENVVLNVPISTPRRTEAGIYKSILEQFLHCFSANIPLYIPDLYNLLFQEYYR